MSISSVNNFGGYPAYGTQPVLTGGAQPPATGVPAGGVTIGSSGLNAGLYGAPSHGSPSGDKKGLSTSALLLIGTGITGAAGLAVAAYLVAQRSGSSTPADESPANVKAAETTSEQAAKESTNAEIAERRRVANLSPDELKKLPPEAVKYVGGCDVQFLSPEQIPHIRDRVIRFVNSPELVQALTKRQIALMTEMDAINKLKPEHAPYLTPQQIDQGAEGSHLTEPSLLQALDEHQLQHVNFAQIPHLRHEQLAYIPNSEVKWIRDKDVIDRLPDAKLEHLHPEEFQLIAEDKQAMLRREVDAVPADSSVNTLSRLKVSLLTNPAQIKHLNASAAQDLPETLHEHLAPEVRSWFVG